MAAPEEADPKRAAIDPDGLAKALEMELIMKRASWEKMRARRGTWRALSFFFLFVVILGALLAYFLFAHAVPQRGAEEPAAERVESAR
ncbi:MAG: hypothetical protein ABI540_06310 [Spartobacteria bacterium]